MIGKHGAQPIEARGDGAIAAGGNVENVSVHVGDVHAVDALPLKVAALDYSAVLAEADLDRFVGREWLTSQIEELVSPAGRQSSTGRYVLVRARAGMGKTALAAWLSRQWDCARHFTRTIGGRDTRIALQSLAAQLIVRYGMQDEFAPGGMLASWVADPARFPAVLEAAAQRATVRGEQVRLVVDGLDEAEGDGPALGLPQPQLRPLPDSVVIVATCREGIPPRRIPHGDAVHTVSIDADGRHNRADIRRFLSAEMRERTIAGRLAAAGLSQQDAIDLLAERCDGVWIYLRYALSQLRVDPGTPVQLNALPTGLTEYYRQQISGHRDDRRFFTHDLPVLSTLAVAGQPMSRDQLSRLSGVPVHEVRWLCDVRYRPFLALDAAYSPPRYSIYHASLREFLHGTPDPNDTGQDPVDASDLSEAISAAHNRISEHYLNLFGGLSRGLDHCLPVLRSHPEFADMDERYPLRHLPIHLHRAGRHRDLDTLLACRQRAGAHLGGLWLDAHDRAGTLDDYLAALALARDTAAQQTDALIVAGRPAATIAAETRCAMLAANLIRSDAVPATLLEGLARTGVWDVTRALWHAHRIRDPDERAKALVALAPLVGEDHSPDRRSGWTRAEVLDDALGAARAIRLDWNRPAALAAVAAQLREQARTDVLDEALGTALGIEDPAYRLRAFVAVTDGLTDPRQIGRAVEAALSIADPMYRAESLLAVTPLVGEPDKGRLLRGVLDIALSMTSPVPATRVLAKVAAQLPDPARKRILDRALGVALNVPVWSGYPGSAIAQVVAAMSDQSQLDSALDAAITMAEPDDRARALAAVASRLTEPERAHTLDRALDAAVATEEKDGKRASALVTVAIQMPEPARTRELGQALEAVAATSGPHRRWRLATIAAHLTDPAQVSRALDIALIVDDQHSRATAMTRIATHLTAAEPLGRALDAVRTLPSEWDRVNALSAIASRLTDPTHLDHAADTARAIADDGDRARALAAVASRMAELGRTEVLDEALDATRTAAQPWNQARALATMSAAGRNRVIDAARAIGDGGYRSDALVAVAEHLAEPVRTQVLDEAAAAARAVRVGGDRMKKLVAVATRLTGLGRARLLGEILDYAATTGSDVDREQTLEAVADQLIEPGQLDRALVAARACARQDSRARAVAAVADRLAEPVRTRLLGGALDAAIAVPEQRERAWALYGIAKHLTDTDQLDRAVEAAFAIADPDWVFAVGSVVPRLAETQRDHVLARALDRAISDTMRPGPWERQLAVVVDHLTQPDHLGRALDVALGLEPDAYSGSGAWTAVFRRVASLSTDISPGDVVRLLRRAFRALPRRRILFDIVGAAAPATARVGGEEALTGQLDLIV